MALLWYGYKYINGGYQAKRYFDIRDIDDVRRSPFVELVTPKPFEADNYDMALYMVESIDGKKSFVGDRD